MFITDIHSLGVDQFAGTQFTDAWYWNFDEQNRAWADRFTAKTQTRPSFAHAANYSAALNYLEAVQAAGTDDADTIVQALEGKKINDVFLRNGEIRSGGPPRHPRRLPGQGQDEGRGQGGLGLRGDHQDDPAARPSRSAGRLLQRPVLTTDGHAIHPVHGPGPGGGRVLRARRPRPGRDLRRARRRELRARRLLHARGRRRGGPARSPSSASASGRRCVIVPIVMFVFGVLIERLPRALAAAARPALQLPADLRAHAACSSTSSSAATACRDCRTSCRARSRRAGSTIGGLSLSAYQIFACLFSLAVCLARLAGAHARPASA